MNVDLRTSKSFEFKQSKPITIPYKTMGLNLPNSVNPPFIQTYYPFPNIKKSLEVSQKSSFPAYKPKQTLPFSFNA